MARKVLKLKHQSVPVSFNWKNNCMSNSNASTLNLLFKDIYSLEMGAVIRIYASRTMYEVPTSLS